MVKKKKYPKIHPSIVKDQNGKEVEVYLKYNVYESIFREMDELKKQLSEFKKKNSKK
ncbi:MAG: hypothetical protein WCE21_02115 [Candidatus Babeliales bacterium]